MPFQARCKQCGEILFDTPSFEAISEKRPVQLTCRGCGVTYLVTHSANDILLRLKGESARENIAAEKYG